MTLAQEKIVIIGGSTGMGLAAALRLLQAGMAVHIAGRSEHKLHAAQAYLNAESGQQAGIHIADFTDPQSLSTLFAEVGKFDHLVLAASSNAAWGNFRDMPANTLRQALEGKLLGYWQSLQAALPYLRADGSVVMLTGGASRTAISGTAGLAAVNGGITQMAQTLALELAPLRINVISPGLVDTPAYDHLPSEIKVGMFAGTASSLPVGRTGKPEDVADAILLMISGTFITGALLDVDGGSRMAGHR